jgi:hypothetical protein
LKVNVEIDCTPLEARQFIGLPDVVPMQTAVMDQLQQQMMSNIEKVSLADPELVQFRSEARRADDPGNVQIRDGRARWRTHW